MGYRPSIAGMWYPQDEEVLRQQIDAYLAAADTTEIDPADVRALIVPHAGFQYSGETAAAGYATLREADPDSIVIVGPLHHHHPGRILTSGHEAYLTPFGPVPVDQERIERISQALAAALGGGLKPLKNEREHSIELQLPFLQSVLGQFEFVPIMLADQSEPAASGLADALTQAGLGENSLVVASSDLSHFHSQQEAERLDRTMIERVVRLDPTGVLSAEQEEVGFACGAGAIAAALWHAQQAGADKARLLRYSTSGDVTGDLLSVVGYAAVCVYQ